MANGICLVHGAYSSTTGLCPQCCSGANVGGSTAIPVMGGITFGPPMRPEALDGIRRAYAAHPGTTPSDLIREVDRLTAALSDAEGALREAREAVAEAARRSALPIAPNVTGLPSTEEECAAAIARCVRLVVDHVTEPLRALAAASPSPAGRAGPEPSPGAEQDGAPVVSEGKEPGR